MTKSDGGDCFGNGSETLKAVQVAEAKERLSSLPGAQFETRFAAAGKAPEGELERDIRLCASSSVVSAVLASAAGLLVLINPERQIIATNLAYMTQLGIEDPEALLGLRPGQALGCINAATCSNACGTTVPCRSCGAAIAIMLAQTLGETATRDCALVRRLSDGSTEDKCFSVRAQPLELAGRPLTLVFLQDVTEARRREHLARSFLHDIGKVVTGLSCSAEMLVSEGGADPALMREVSSLSRHLAREVSLQRLLLGSDDRVDGLEWCTVTLSELAVFAEQVFSHHPVARERRLVTSVTEPTASLVTERTLLERCLINLLVNAFEASLPGESISLRLGESDGAFSFTVTNQLVLSESVQSRLFQRQFSTKSGTGRGIGTHSTRLIVEQLLKGQLGFRSELGSGTAFTITLPSAPPDLSPEVQCVSVTLG